MGRPRGSTNKNRSVMIGRAVTAESFTQATAFPIDNPSILGVGSPAEKFSADAKEKEKIANAVKQVPEIFTTEQVAWLFDAYAAILSFSYSLLLKIDYKAISEELSFSEDEKEHMSKPLAKILSKYCPSEWAGMSAEIELITGLGIWTVSSFARAKNVAAKQAEEKRRKNQTHPVEPMRRTGEVLTPA